ncbi:3-hydroxyphenylacetate 6-hydroxylase [Sphaceloma murrayae]|uniref:3-hydroxyphenylacetate 6-hydroxylase n=1 Tax=Sphaceloma murrayae TaxID=2082308 RepID=A0A2K1QTH4_9PEZI|nr:3-hydroxyphenylacetate 6-hydroxylase [Sphaceloma murrayae]
MHDISLNPLDQSTGIVGRLLSSTLTSASGLIVLIFTILLAYITFEYGGVLKQRMELPPGPFPLPIFGNHFAIPKSKPWIAFEQWSKEYNNPLITVWLGSRPIIILNDAWTASDLLDKRAAIYASRPTMIVMADVSGQTNINQTTLPYGDRWRNHRKLMHTAVGSQAVRDYRSFQGDEVKIMTKEILDSPSDYVMSIERYSSSVVSIIGWGRRISRKNDYVVQQALLLMQSVDAIIPGQYMMESIPWLSYLPSIIYALPSQLRLGSTLFTNYFYHLSLEGSSAAEENFSKRLLREQSSSSLSNAEIAGLTANLIGGGVDTTSSSILTFLLAMTAFPEKQRLAHEELDRVCGGRSPTWDDEASLPYIAATVKETLRWRTVTILAGIPHAPTQDDVYRGYRIPAGTTMTGNLWAIHRHEREFPEPDEFRPERYLHGLQFSYPNSRGHNAFGWGRRQCSGQPLAEQSLFSSIARLLWAFEILPGLDEKGDVVKPDIFAYSDSENMRPLPFAVRFVPRGEGRRAEIEREAAEAGRRLRRWEGETELTVEGAAKGGIKVVME